MCGISGIFNLKNGISNLQQNEAIKAAMRLKHRGPDHLGVWKNETGLLAHNKLSILDFSDKSNQPVTVGDVVVIFNGEIYNYKLIAENLGLDPETIFSDVYVIAHGYNAFGAEIFEKISGDFAIALYDLKKKKLFLVRDRLGVKQIVYHFENNTLRFSSEVKAFLEYSDISLKLNKTRLLSDLAMSFWADKNDTYFESIQHVPAGHILEFDLSGVVLTEYWSIECKNDNQNLMDTDAKKIDYLDSLLLQATKDRLIGEASIGSLLSGGVDSSILTAMIASSQPENFNAYTIVYDEGEENRDLDYALSVVDRYANISSKINHISRSDANIENLDLITYHMEEVVWDKVYWSMYINYLNASKDGLRVIINGQGSDEVWLGYYHDFAHYQFSEKQLSHEALIGYFTDKYEDDLSYLSDAAKEKLPGCIKATLEKNFDPYRSEFDSLNAIAVWATKTYLQSNLMQEDRMSMASSVECRVPFTDHLFVNAAFALNSGEKVRDKTEKWPIKEIGRRYLPAAICDRQKMAFVNPSANYNQEAMNYLVSKQVEIKRSVTMQSLFGPSFFEALEQKREFKNPEFSWKAAAVHRFLSIYNLD